MALNLVTEYLNIPLNQTSNFSSLLGNNVLTRMLVMNNSESVNSSCLFKNDPVTTWVIGQNQLVVAGSSSNVSELVVENIQSKLAPASSFVYNKDNFENDQGLNQFISLADSNDKFTSGNNLLGVTTNKMRAGSVITTIPVNVNDVAADSYKMEFSLTTTTSSETVSISVETKKSTATTPNGITGISVSYNDGSSNGKATNSCMIYSSSGAPRSWVNISDLSAYKVSLFYSNLYDTPLSEAQITNISGVDVDTLVPSLNIEFNSDPANTGSDKLFETDSGVYKIYVANSAVVSLWTVGSTPLLVSGTSDNKLYLLTGVADADAGGADAGKKVLTLEEMPDSSSVQL